MNFRSKFANILQVQPGDIGKLNPDAYHTDYMPEYCFQNAIGHIVIYNTVNNGQCYTYLAFYRDIGSTQTVSYFSINGHNITPELYKVGKYAKQLASEKHEIWDDVPDIKNSAAAYLLDPNFKITEENFYDCVYNYLTAPAMLYFENCFEETRRIQDPEKTKAFAEIFRNLPLTQVPKGEPFHGSCQYSFINAIGDLTLYEYRGNTYITLSLDYSGCVACFRAEGDLISEVNSVGESLKDNSEIPLLYEFQDNWGA